MCDAVLWTTTHQGWDQLLKRHCAKHSLVIESIFPRVEGLGFCYASLIAISTWLIFNNLKKLLHTLKMGKHLTVSDIDVLYLDDIYVIFDV